VFEATLSEIWRSGRRSGKSGGEKSRGKELSDVGLPIAFGLYTGIVGGRAVGSRGVRIGCVVVKKLGVSGVA
jgi:hypothetical protein